MSPPLVELFDNFSENNREITMNLETSATSMMTIQQIRVYFYVYDYDTYVTFMAM